MNIEVSILIQIIASSVSLTGIVLGFVFTWIKIKEVNTKTL